MIEATASASTTANIYFTMHILDKKRILSASTSAIMSATCIIKNIFKNHLKDFIPQLLSAYLI